MFSFPTTTLNNNVNSETIYNILPSSFTTNNICEKENQKICLINTTTKKNNIKENRKENKKKCQEFYKNQTTKSLDEKNTDSEVRKQTFY